MSELPTVHTSVLLHDVIDGFALSPEATVLDATLGGGGHFLTLAEQLGSHGTMIGLDADPAALARVEHLLAEHPPRPRVHLRQANFRSLEAVLDELALEHLDAALFDLGLSSDQLELSGRGFSLKRDEPLDMRFAGDRTEGSELTASLILNEWSEETLAEILRGFGEERRAARIARAIVARRTERPFHDTSELVSTVEEAVGPPRGRIHPATKTFQALRIAVNDELGALSEGLAAAWEHLAVGGRIAVISFHSLEDRIVKRFFREQAHRRHASLLTKRPLTPSREECLDNPRARSAKLRIAEKQTDHRTDPTP
ncbi:16S rRNA (cytosine(1402)-N(4))-methyltransferase RsmH [Patescibacteria group bacterium]|jgi:16S rRNA (cytosine1402-N4)-methyltransferase|nr:16S rRNA (cytosine(1402)-N(4))-methyltransferase RsmH [Patescibacteria group bacterium]